MNESLALLVLLVLSGFFSGSETALTVLSRARAEGLHKEGRAGARALWQLKQNTTRMLIVLLIGNNLVNIAASALATVIATERFGHLGPGIAVGVLTLVILVFGEVTPKTWAARHAERISLFAAPPLLAFGRIVTPLAWALEGMVRWLHRIGRAPAEPTVTESELLSMAAHGAREGSIESDEHAMIERVFQFNDLCAHDVMTPRSEVFALPADRPLREALPEILQEPYTRIPLYRDSLDDIRKILFLRELLEAVAQGHLDVPLEAIAKEANATLFTPETQPIDELFTTLIAGKRHLAIVVDEYGVLQGVVSLEDVLEELVGEIYDESDRLNERLSELKPGRIVVDGRTELRAIMGYFKDIQLPGKPTDSVSLWLLNRIERIPTTGEKFQLDGLQVSVTKASKRRIQTLSITRSEAPQPPSKN
jgi:CBS domain containing-hemolysin-like protein